MRQRGSRWNRYLPIGAQPLARIASSAMGLNRFLEEIRACRTLLKQCRLLRAVPEYQAPAELLQPLEEVRADRRRSPVSGQLIMDYEAWMGLQSVIRSPGSDFTVAIEAVPARPHYRDEDGDTRYDGESPSEVHEARDRAGEG